MSRADSRYCTVYLIGVFRLRGHFPSTDAKLFLHKVITKLPTYSTVSVNVTLYSGGSLRVTVTRQAATAATGEAGNTLKVRRLPGAAPSGSFTMANEWLGSNTCSACTLASGAAAKEGTIASYALSSAAEAVAATHGSAEEVRFSSTEKTSLLPGRALSGTPTFTWNEERRGERCGVGLLQKWGRESSLVQQCNHLQPVGEHGADGHAAAHRRW